MSSFQLTLFQLSSFQLSRDRS